jgi:hypothetical protein
MSKKLFMKKILLFSAFTFYMAFASGTVRHVPSAYSTIQSALNACIAGDTILVQPGTYMENITWPSVNSIALLSAGDSSNTIIDGNAADRVITFYSGGIDTTTVIRGFKITNGRLYVSHSYGAGIYFYNASPKIVECEISGNRLDSTAQWCYGAGIHCSNSSNPVFRKSSISNNITVSTSWAYGGGVHCTYTSSPTFYDCIISDNYMTGNGWAYGAGIYMTQNSSPQLVNTVISGNHSNDPYRCYGGGLYAESGSSPVLTNVLISGNIMDGNAIWYYGGGAYFTGANAVLMNVTVADNVRSNGSAIVGSGIYAVSASTVTAANSIFWNNNSGAEVSVSSATVTIDYSCVRGGYTGTGNISSAPMFTSASDYHLQLTSQCINAGTLSGAPSFDLENNPRPQPALTNPDMGCYEIDQTITGLTSTAPDVFNITIYPNPASESCTIYSQQSAMERLEIYDGTGKKVFSLQPETGIGNQISLDLSLFPNGIYFCRIISGENSMFRKLVKQ